MNDGAGRPDVILSPSSVISCSDAAFQNPRERHARRRSSTRRIVSVHDHAARTEVEPLPRILSAVEVQQARAVAFRPAVALRSEPILLSQRRPIGATQSDFFCSQQPRPLATMRARARSPSGVSASMRVQHDLARSYWRTSRRAKDCGSRAAVAPPFLGDPPGRGRSFFQKLVIRRQANPSETKETR